ncbi:protein S40-2-like [Bidens hawaiensis]|uniref:protein S40-2-like n=1 Tax=Bidens hawaiensis TaxID=980011 RepID=UPI004049A126
MDDELEESEVVFVHVEVSTKHDNCFKFEKCELKRLKRKKTKKRKIASAPINISENKSNIYEELSLESDLFEEDDASEGQIIPPHVTWDWKIAENVAYSICTRRREALKIRDFILKMTGFHEI